MQLIMCYCRGGPETGGNQAELPPKQGEWGASTADWGPQTKTLSHDQRGNPLIKMLTSLVFVCSVPISGFSKLVSSGLTDFCKNIRTQFPFGPLTVLIIIWILFLEWKDSSFCVLCVLFILGLFNYNWNLFKYLRSPTRKKCVDSCNKF